MVPYIHTRDGITVVLKGKPYHSAKDDKTYPQVVEAVSRGFGDQAILDIFEAASQAIQAVTKLTTNMEYSGGVVKYRGEVLANYAVDKLIELLSSGQPYQPLVNFLENLMQNPSKRVVDDLYRFLEKGKMPITPDGHFLAYKKVRSDYRDIHSGKFENKIGARFEMPRNQVDEDAQRTCSVGFHVCSYDYLPNFASSGDDKVVVCKVNPAHVVAIPADYNDTKMRVYKYEVTDEVTDYFKKQERILSSAPVMTEHRDFRVVYEDDRLGGSYEDGVYWTLEEAKKQAQFVWDNDLDTYRVWVEQISTDQVLFMIDNDTAKSEEPESFRHTGCLGV